MFIPLQEFADSPDYSLAIFIAKTNHGNNHTGILIKSDGKIKFYHLAWHLKFECDLWENLLNNEIYKIKKWVKFEAFASDTTIFEYRLPAIIKFMEYIYKENANKIPYATNFSQTRFTDDGQLVLGENENGLTCATFVQCYFDSVGLNLVDLETWIHRDEDNDWKKFVIGMMVISQVSENHIANVEKEPLNYRLKPEEIAVASSKSLSELPADFTFCSVNGAIFNAFIDDN
jgi:hypothetical protein